MRASAITQSVSGTVGFRYDGLYNRTSLIYPDGKEVNYAYDALSRMQQVTDWAQRVITYTYTVDSQLAGTWRPNSVTSSYEYDGLGQLYSLTHTGPSGMIAQYVYTYDANGNRIMASESFTNTITIDYDYDPLDRLTAADYPSFTYTFWITYWFFGCIPYDIPFNINFMSSPAAADGSQTISVSDATSDLIIRLNKSAYYLEFPASKPSWFPDGNSLVFVASTKPNERSALFRVDRDGQYLRVLVPEGVRNAVVAPDGQHIAYIENAPWYEFRTIARIILVDQDGRKRQVLATIKGVKDPSILDRNYVRDLSWSPDGNWLIFTSNYSDKFQLYIVSVNGGGFRRLFDFPGDAVFPQWRPGH